MSLNMNKKSVFDLKKETFFLFMFWTFFVGISFFLNIYNNEKNITEIAHTHALITFEKDVVYRQWNAMHGGVYVPLSEKTPENPYLDVKDKIIQTTSGKVLTLVNPAYMTRQVSEIEAEYIATKSHITSLKPIRPGNAPDMWERTALQKFEKGINEEFELVDFHGKQYWRFMQPFITKSECLKCHIKQGYKEGDIRGGISISIPADSLLLISRKNIIGFIFGHLLFWFLGISGILQYYRKTARHSKRRDEIEGYLNVAKSKLQEWNKDLENKVEEKVKELEKAQKILMKKEKLATLGQLGAGIVHELNNPLAGILSVIYSLKTSRNFNTQEQELLADMQKACEHMAVVIKSLNLFSRQSEGNRQKLDCNEVIEETLAFSSAQLKSKGIVVEKNFCKDLFLVKADKHQIQQIIINMISNAKDAMSRNGIFSITTKNIDIRGKKFIEMIFADNGSGMKKELVKNIFDPFFTSKAKGEGVGLGLSIVHNIVESHNGQIEVDTVEGKGTVFTIRLPESKED